MLDLLLTLLAVGVVFSVVDNRLLWKRLRAMEDALLERAKLEGDLE